MSNIVKMDVINHWWIQGARRVMAPKRLTKFFCPAKKLILGQIGQLHRLCKCKKRSASGDKAHDHCRWTSRARGSAPEPRYRFALRTHHPAPQTLAWIHWCQKAKLWLNNIKQRMKKILALQEAVLMQMLAAHFQ